VAAKPVYSFKTASPYKEAAPILAELQTNYEFFFTKKTPDEQKEESQQTRKIRKQDISTNRVIQEAEKFVKTSSNSKSKHVVLGTGPKSL
jgi:hypothetical protein